MVEGGHFSDREIKKENKKKVRGKDMTKFFVKKPYFVLVTVIIVLVIGFVSLGEMQTDLLPKMELPYMAVITTEDIMIIWYIINVEFTKVKRITHYKICIRFL